MPTLGLANNPNIRDCWCHVCHRGVLLGDVELWSFDGLTHYGGYTYICRDCLRDLAVALQAAFGETCGA